MVFIWPKAGCKGLYQFTLLREVGCAGEGLWSIVTVTTQDTFILYPAEALPSERLTKSGRGGQIIVSILKQQIKQSAGAGTAHTNAAHSPRVSGHCFPLTVQAATHHGAPSKAEVGNLPCQLTHYSRLPADYTFPLPENNSKQIRHSICLGQLPQTVKTSIKTQVGKSGRMRSLFLSWCIFMYIKSYSHRPPTC